MRHRKILFLVLLTITISNSFCGKEFLNPPVPGKIIRQLYVKDLSTTQEFLGGLYNNITPILAGSSMLYPEIVSDNIKPVTGGNMFVSHYQWLQEAGEEGTNDQNLNQLYTDTYNVIYGCNFTIDCANKYREENEEKADDIKGQALSIRALMYHLLVNLFAQPYIFTANASHPGVAINTSFDWKTLPAKRSTVSEVYDYMITDLKEAIELLPNSQGNTFFINRNGAKCLMARILLFKGDYQNASAYARQVSDEIPIMTASYPKNLFTLKETEAIFQIDQNLVTPTVLASYFLKTEPVQFYATADIAGMLQESSTDKRSSWITQSTNGSNIDWIITKYPQGVISGIPEPAISYYHTVFRSSEMYLTCAEAYAKMGSQFEDSARFFLNKIRMRADPMAVEVTVSGQPLQDSIYKERRKEFSFEGLRMFDLSRWKLGVSRIDVPDPSYSKLPFGSNFAIAPIPQQDVNLVGYTQNIGY